MDRQGAVGAGEGGGDGESGDGEDAAGAVLGEGRGGEVGWVF